MFASYNDWANTRLYDVAQTLDDAAFARDVGVFFGSLCATLNHVLVGDRIWMGRFTGEGSDHVRLDDVPFPDFGDLRDAREREDARITAYMRGLDDAALEGHFTYRPITIPDEITQPLAPTLAHFFNHQTHHRGQAHGILSILGCDPPPLDLIYFQRTEAGQAFL